VKPHYIILFFAFVVFLTLANRQQSEAASFSILTCLF
jgi:hypothetical protein